MKTMEEEINDMLVKIGPLVEKVKTKDAKGQEMLTNMKAYIADSRHFLEKGILIKSFEAIVWAWAILEICEDLGVFRLD